MFEINLKQTLKLDRILENNSLPRHINFEGQNFPQKSALFNLYESVIDQIQLAFILLDNSGKIIKCNKKCVELLDIRQEYLIGKHVLELYTEVSEDNGSIPGELKNLCNLNIKSTEFDIKIRSKDKIKIININMSKVFSNGEDQYCLFCKDETGKYKKEQELTEKISESDIRIKEMHHRIKNNLQLVNSILNIEYNKHKPHDDISIKSILKESQNKIFTIALIHQNLYENNCLDSIQVKPYIYQLFDYISNIYNSPHQNIFLDVEDEWKFLPIKTSIYIGLIIDEIITNSFKHAFQKIQNGRIKILLKKDKLNATLHIRDNGHGFIVKNYKQYNSFGMELIYTLVKQLKGKIEINSEVGTEYKIQFPVSF